MQADLHEMDFFLPWYDETLLMRHETLFKMLIQILYNRRKRPTFVLQHAKGESDDSEWALAVYPSKWIREFSNGGH